MKKYICKYCGKEFETPQKLGGHVTCCSKNPKYNEFVENRVTTKHKNANIKVYDVPCEICGTIFQIKISEKNYKLGNHKKTCCKKCALALSVKNTDKTIKNKNISKTTKGRKMSDETYIKHYGNKSNCVETIVENDKISKKRKDIIRYCLECNSPIDFSVRSHQTKFCCDECKNKHWRRELSNKLKGKTGGYRVLSGNKKHKSGKYNDIYFDSSWELAFYVYCKENNIDIKRCNIVRKYIYHDKEYKYYPDFIVNNEIVEIKGYITDRTKCKIEYNPDVKVLYEADIKSCLDYCKEKYGEKFWESFYKS